jgi:predicted DNA-binding transcriptional regulator YafY
VQDGAEGVEVRVTATRTDCLVRRLLPLGRSVRAVSPEGLREELLSRARAAVEAYTGT